MAKIPNIGGTLTINGNAQKVRSVEVAYSKEKAEVTELGSVKKQYLPGRYERVFSFVLFAQDGTTDNWLRTHAAPASVAAGLADSVTLSYTDAGGITITATGFLESAKRIDAGDGQSGGIWDCVMVEN